MRHSGGLCQAASEILDRSAGIRGNFALCRYFGDRPGTIPGPGERTGLHPEGSNPCRGIRRYRRKRRERFLSDDEIRRLSERLGPTPVAGTEVRRQIPKVGAGWFNDQVRSCAEGGGRGNRRPHCDP